MQEMTAGVPPPSVPIHSVVEATTPVPSEVAKTVVAASEPGCPGSSPWWWCVGPVVFWKLSAVRRSPGAGGGHGDLRETVSPAMVCVGRRAPTVLVGEDRGSQCQGRSLCRRPGGGQAVKGIGGSLDQLGRCHRAGHCTSKLYAAGRHQCHRRGREGLQTESPGTLPLDSFPTARSMRSR